MRPGFPHQMAPSAAADHGSTWHSPVPYLFGGLAAMLGLIAFALLILACSYWRISGFLDDDQDHHHAANSNNDSNSSTAAATSSSKPTPYLEEGFVVIMAGDDKPTFLATPVTARPSPFGLDTTTTTTTTTTTSSSSSSSIAGGKITGGEPAEEEEGKGGADGGSHQHQ